MKNFISWLISNSILRTLLTIVMVVFWTACADDSQNLKGPDADAASAKPSAPKSKMDVPTISCVSNSKSSITINVLAGATGTPAGFSIQWMTAEAFGQSGWPLNSDEACKASFSGNAKDSRYLLGSGKSIQVTIGDITDDNGASSNCWDFLECGTAYVFRVFAHASSTLNRSDFSSEITCSTDDCEGGCTYTQGYWKNHGPEGCASGNNFNAWPALAECAKDVTVTTTDEFGNTTSNVVSVNGMLLGSVCYTDLELCAILNTPVGTGPGANGLIALAHQLIAAKLNLANGATTAGDILATVAAADALIDGKVVPPTNGSTTTVKTSLTSTLTAALDAYNKGNHCE